MGFCEPTTCCFITCFVQLLLFLCVGVSWKRFCKILHVPLHALKSMGTGHYLLFTVVCVLAIDSSCIAVETTALSLRLKWCKELTDAYNHTATSAVLGVFWNNNDSMQYICDVQSMEIFVSGLTPNTEYLLVFDVNFRGGQNNNGPPIRQRTTRKIRTKYFSKFITIKLFIIMFF